MGLAKKFYALKNITYYYNLTNHNNHKIITERKIIDTYKGLRDYLYISKSMKLFNLYCLVLSRFNSDYIINNAKKFVNSEKLKDIISQILQRIDYTWLIKKKYEFSIKKEFYNQFY